MGFGSDLYNSFKTNTDGFSARKISAFVVMSCVVIAHFEWLKYAYQHENFSLMPEILMIDYGFIAVCLGLTTWQSLKQPQISNSEISKDEQPKDELGADKKDV